MGFSSVDDFVYSRSWHNSVNAAEQQGQLLEIGLFKSWVGVMYDCVSLN